jgi:acyl-CoA reductase-like NAD-dependent aldehyde dehydrogenase
LARAGYDYAYFDRDTWQELPVEQRQAFLQPCVQLFAQQKTELGDFRRLLDIRNCGEGVAGHPGSRAFEW